MGLKVRKILLTNFRNYKNYNLEIFDSNVVIFEGPNAVGKSNILEAIQLVTSFKSFRSSKYQDFILFGEDEGSVRIDFEDLHRSIQMELRINQEGKTFFLNDKRKSINNLRGVIPSVIFIPDDLSLIKGSQSVKRAAIDAIGMQVTKNYQIIKRDYEKLISHKNKIIKENYSDLLIETINETLLKVGSQFYLYRSHLIGKLIPLIKKYYYEISDMSEHVDVYYIPSWEVCLGEVQSEYTYPREQVVCLYEQALKETKETEREKGRALIGPHADTLEFYIDGKNIRSFGSQGQQRSVALSFKLAELEVLTEATGQKPILLLDDVMSELDIHRREKLISHIENGFQTFITTTNLEYFNEEVLKEANIIHLR